MDATAKTPVGATKLATIACNTVDRQQDAKQPTMYGTEGATAPTRDKEGWGSGCSVVQPAERESATHMLHCKYRKPTTTVESAPAGQTRLLLAYF